MDFGKIRFNYGGQSYLNNLSHWEENRKEIVYKINNRLSMIPTPLQAWYV